MHPKFDQLRLRTKLPITHWFNRRGQVIVYAQLPLRKLVIFYVNLYL